MNTGWNHGDAADWVDSETLAGMMGWSRRTLFRRMAAGLIPRPAPRGGGHRFNVPALVGHLERADPWLAVRLAGEGAKLRAVRGELERLRGAR